MVMVMTKIYKKNRNNFYVPVKPIKCIKNYRTRFWFLVDSNNIILAENLTKETANMIETLVNVSDEMLKLLKELYDFEDIVVYKKEELFQKIYYRETLIKVQYNILKKFGLPVKRMDTQDYHENLWDYFYNL